MKREGAQDRINAFLEIPNELLQPFIASHLAQEPQEPPARVRFLSDEVRRLKRNIKRNGVQEKVDKYLTEPNELLQPFIASHLGAFFN